MMAVVTAKRGSSAVSPKGQSWPFCPITAHTAVVSSLEGPQLEVLEVLEVLEGPCQTAGLRLMLSGVSWEGQSIDSE